MYSIGDIVVHPLHGAGVIDEIENKYIGKETKAYYVLHLQKGNITVKIPVDSCDEIGVRPLVKPEYAEAIINSFKNIETEITQNWNKRYRDNLVKIKSGNLMEVAGVIKELMERDLQKGLSNGERKMLRSAKQIFISEIVLSQKSSYEEVEQRLNLMVAGSF